MFNSAAGSPSPSVGNAPSSAQPRVATAEVKGAKQAAQHADRQLEHAYVVVALHGEVGVEKRYHALELGIQTHDLCRVQAIDHGHCKPTPHVVGGVGERLQLVVAPGKTLVGGPAVHECLADSVAPPRCLGRCWCHLAWWWCCLAWRRCCLAWWCSTSTR
eukprot:scaffold36873_cov78-Phaeocystis_antarctica.AAC.11